MAKRAGEKSNRELDREVEDTMASDAVLSSGDVYSSLLPGSEDIEIVARAVPAARASRVVRWTKPDQEALRRVLRYVRGFAANRGLSPAFPRLIPSGDARSGFIYHLLESRHASDPIVAQFSTYDRASAAETVARQAALAVGIVVPGMEGSEGRRGRRP